VPDSCALVERDSKGGELMEEVRHIVDLSKIDFEALKAKFEKSRKRIETEKLRLP